MALRDCDRDGYNAGMDEKIPLPMPDDAGVPTSAPAVQVKRIVRRPPPPRSINWSQWIIIPLVFFLGMGSGWLLWGQTTSAADNQVTIDQNVKRFDVPDGGNPSIGPADAPITIVEFSDYQCPFCIRWYQDVSARLFENYKGKIRFVYRDFPLYSLHPDAESAAEAADCAGEQNNYYAYHDLLFSQKYGLGNSAYIKYASDLGLKMDQFNTCVSEHRYKSEVDADVKFASSIGVSSTPTFFVNGLAVVGAQPYEVFQQIIDKELAGTISK
jgi:protein-disulfide isomerase